jgi:very-short-patch-repair endonuclease
MGMLDELAERGRRGITLMRELLGERGPDYRPNDTGVEDRMYELCRRVGLEVTRQRDLSGPEEWLGRVDLLVVGTTVVLEVDSALYHEALIDQAADAARRAALTAAGYEVHSFSDHDIFYETHSTMERLRLIRRSLRSGR